MARCSIPSDVMVIRAPACVLRAAKAAGMDMQTTLGGKVTPLSKHSGFWREKYCESFKPLWDDSNNVNKPNTRSNKKTIPIT